MNKVPRIIPISDLRQDAAAVLRSVKQSKDPVIITQRGRAAAVMLSVEAYEAAEGDRELLIALAQGEREIKEGKGHSLKNVMDEAGKILEDGRS
jgi:prevent-host-death family protein